MSEPTLQPPAGPRAAAAPEGAALPWRRALVYGLGLSGRAASRLLLRHGVRVLAVDDRDPAAAPDHELADLTARSGFEARPAAALERLPDDVEVVVASPGVPPERLLLAAARERGLPVIAEVELAFRCLDGTVVGITGSNGKSTTTALAGALIAAGGRSVAVCGNIGEPLSEVVEGPAGRVFVVELSSFQLEAIDRFRPRAAALLNLAPDHLDRHHDFESYAAAKQRLFERQGEGDFAVLNADDQRVRDVALPPAVRRRLFSRRGPVGDGCYVLEDRVVEVAPGEPPRTLFALEDLRLEGAHNLENAMAAALLARGLEVGPEELAAGLRGFAGLPHRVQRVGELRGVAWVDDSKGTNVAATLRSLEGFGDGTVHLILGGRGKGADFAPLREAVASKARAVYLIGESASALEAALRLPERTRRSETLERAVGAAAESAHAGEVVLLSPACASFDQFESFVDRGRTFQRLARALPGFLPAAPGREGGGG
ncbi:MAG TPA: UDP-N-acetylmuramoyl-L-alanine--D-glutamate ligase [Thermoanaerobaculia bacterium]|nr:UDP-N-acetylmuramoyl-L-alanine--D-glutamate ligase [Thermoanaerobaculia bacterium]